MIMIIIHTYALASTMVLAFYYYILLINYSLKAATGAAYKKYKL